MGGLLLRKAQQLVLVLWGISTLLFILLRLSGDPAARLAGQDADPEQIESIRERLGLTEPLVVQYTRFVANTVQLDFGTSFTYRQPAMETVLERLPASIILALAAVALSFFVAIIFGTYAASRRNTLRSTAVVTATLIGQSTPNFVLGVALILIFSVHFGVLPTFGFESWTGLVLPTVTLASFLAARQTRIVRSLVLDELNKDYVRVARAGGLGERRILYRHVLRNVLVPVVGLVGIDVGQMFGGAVVTETVFAWPGVGRLMVDAVLGSDYPVVQATVFVIALLVFLLNFLIELLYRVIDPLIGRQAARS